MTKPARRIDILGLVRKFERLSVTVTDFEAFVGEDGGACFTVYVLDKAGDKRPVLERVVKGAGLRLLGLGRTAGGRPNVGARATRRPETFASFCFQP